MNDPRVRPANLAEAAEAVGKIAARGLSLRPIGAGSRGWLGRPAESEAVLIETRDLRNLEHYEPGDLTVTVEAGMAFETLAGLLEAEGQWLPVNPARSGQSTLGGLLATGATGSIRSRYGSWRDLVLGMSVVLADGSLSRSGGRVVKNVSGYDLHKLHIGALGTLGLIGSVSLRVMPLPKEQRLVLASFKDRAVALEVAMATATSQLELAAVEVLDNLSPSIGLAEGTWMAVRIAGTEADCARSAREIQEASRMAGSRRHVTLAGTECLRALRDLNELPMEGTTICRISAPPSLAIQLLKQGSLGGDRRVICDIPGGIVHVLWNGDAEPSEIIKSVDGIRAGLGRSGSAILLDAPDGVRAGIDVWGPPPPSYPLMQSIKRALDPDRIWNRGRFIGDL